MAGGEAPATGDPANGRMKVFVSYSRADVAFADELLAELEDRGFDAILDRHDIDPGEAWKSRLGALLLSADAVVFVLTEKSAGSPICAWEVDEARRLAKRIVPVAPGPFEGAPPQALADLNWIHFYTTSAIPGSGLLDGARKLDRALRVDLAWLRQQTLLQEQTSRWTGRGAAPDSPLLLRGELLAEAHIWTQRLPAGSIVPEGIAAFLAASDAHESRLKAEAQSGLLAREEAVKASQEAAAEKTRLNRRVRHISIAALVAGVVFAGVAAALFYFASVKSAEGNDLRAALFAQTSQQLSDKGDHAKALLVAVAGDPVANVGFIESLLRPEGNAPVRAALERAYASNMMARAETANSIPFFIGASASGATYLTADDNVPAEVWRFGEAKPALVLGALGDEMPLPAISTNGAYIAISDARGAISIRNVASTQLEWTIPAQGATVDRDAPMSLAVSDDGAQVLAGYDFADNALLWHRDQPETPTAFPVQDSTIGVAISASGERIAYVDDGDVVVWKIGDAAPLRRFSTNEEMFKVALSGNGFIAAALEADGELYLWNVETGDTIVERRDEANPALGLAVDPDGSRIAVGRLNGEIDLISSADGSMLGTLSGQSALVFALAFSPDGQQLFSGAVDRTVRRWDLRPKAPSKNYEVGLNSWQMLLSPGGDRALLRDLEDGVVIWKVGDPRMPARERVPGNSNLAFHPDGIRFAVDPNNRPIEIREPGAAAGALKLEGIEYRYASSMAFSPDGKNLLAGIDGNRAAMWSLARPAQPIWQRDGFSESLDVAFSGDGSQFILVSANREIEIWRTGDTAPIQTLALDRIQPVSAIAFAPDGLSYAIAFDNGEILLLKVGETSPFRTLKTMSQEMHSIAFSPDGQHLLGATGESALLWRIDSASPVETFPKAARTGATFLPNGRQFMSAGANVKVWDLNPILFASAAEQTRLACEKLAAIGVTRFTVEDRLALPILAAAPDEPCVAAGYAKPTPKPASAKPASVKPAAAPSPP